MCSGKLNITVNLDSFRGFDESGAGERIRTPELKRPPDAPLGQEPYFLPSLNFNRLVEVASLAVMDYQL